MGEKTGKRSFIHFFMAIMTTMSFLAVANVPSKEYAILLLGGCEDWIAVFATRLQLVLRDEEIKGG